MSLNMACSKVDKSIPNAFYTYAHINLKTNKIFYIGKGKNKRYLDVNKRNKHWQGIVNKYGFKAIILAYWDTEKEAFDHEKLLIACFKDIGCGLANKTNGGEGTASLNLKQAALNRPKRIVSQSQKAKISDSLKGNKHTDETKKKMSISALNRKPQNRPPCKDETKILLSQKLKGRVVTEEWRKKISATKLAKKG